MYWNNFTNNVEEPLEWGSSVLRTGKIEDVISDDSEEEYLSPAELARRLNISLRAVRDDLYSSNPRIPAVKILGRWRICWSAVQRKLNRGAL
jgi:hypothetical protein